MSSFCTAKATHIFFSKKFQHICVSLDVNFNESLTKDIVSFEQLGPESVHLHMFEGTFLLDVAHLRKEQVLFGRGHSEIEGLFVFKGT